MHDWVLKSRFFLSNSATHVVKRTDPPLSRQRQIQSKQTNQKPGTLNARENAGMLDTNEAVINCTHNFKYNFVESFNSF